ncbi:L,D-transpeptidase [Limnofasciculus baicalensis]|uniref:L,D-transpeptidase n=1 Tax=Limnofasciculus baicalensis BBK-W-15 TaxID=2699891 RepID=A0AAE3KKB7_9CYAN|nr:L,D-transpeptidase [Limnofasciculus baicalensis]MCP2726884.1 L,D-transpeptidase [Limnofasciculus baicalensis BBK-W-15]
MGKNLLKTSLLLLFFGGAIALFLVRGEKKETKVNKTSFPPPTSQLSPLTSSSEKEKRSPKKLSADWLVSFDSPFPLAGLLIQNSSPFHPKTIQQVSPITPILNLAIASISSQLIVDLSDAKVYSYWGNKRISSYPVAIGQKGWETPTGTFKVLKKIRNPVWVQPITEKHIPVGIDNPLGDRWIGFWADERHQIGFHGTNDEKLVGQAISHGCLRMRNQDIRALYNQVTLGTPVIVRK